MKPTKEITNIPISAMFRVDPKGQASINLLDPPPSYSDLQRLNTIIYYAINDRIVSCSKSGSTLPGTGKNGKTICNSSRRFFKDWNRVARQWGKFLCSKSLEPNPFHTYRIKDREVITQSKALGSLLRLKVWPEILPPPPPRLVPKGVLSSFRRKPLKYATHDKLPYKSTPVECSVKMRLTELCPKSFDWLKTYLVRKHCLFDKALPGRIHSYTYKILITATVTLIGVRNESRRLKPYRDIKMPTLSVLIGKRVKHGYKSTGT